LRLSLVNLSSVKMALKIEILFIFRSKLYAGKCSLMRSEVREAVVAF
jgi:hypothetical protein